jgi:uncharacterized membrane protein YdjX (TVP38/TMEM64 family)
MNKARPLGADGVACRAGSRLQRLNDSVATAGGRFVGSVRLVLLFPFNVLNYALSLTRIAFSRASRGGMIAWRANGRTVMGA